MYMREGERERDEKSIRARPPVPVALVYTTQTDPTQRGPQVTFPSNIYGR